MLFLLGLRKCPYLLAHGTADPLADVATPARLNTEFAARGAHLDPKENGAPGGRLVPMYVELLTFDDPETRLPAIDRLEGSLHGGPSPYRRVLVPVWATGAVFPDWLYVGEDSTMIRSTLTGRPRWQ